MVMVENNKTSSSTHYDGSLIARYTYDDLLGKKIYWDVLILSRINKTFR